MKSNRLDWFIKEFKKLKEEVDDEINNLIHSRTKTMKLLNLLCSEIEYNTTDVVLFRNDYLVCKYDIEVFIKELVEKECLRKLLKERTNKTRCV